MKLVITGGHHSSAIPVIKKLQKDYPDIKIHWFGHKYSVKKNKIPTLEHEEITTLGIPFHNLIAGKLYKTYDPIRLLKIPLGILHAKFLLMKIKPDLILSFGGYLAAPTVLAGHILRIPSITHEQTVVTGYANKLIGKFAKKIMVSWPQSLDHLPKDKTVVTGLPLRKSIFKTKSNSYEINKHLPTVYITGGKTGAHKINVAVEDSLENLLKICNVIHQCGAHSIHRDFERLTEKYEDIKHKSEGKYYPKKFILEDEIGEVFNKSDLLVSRAGAHTVTEIIALEKPALLIPIPWVSHNEQNRNAKIVEEAGLAHILDEKRLSSHSLSRAVSESLDDLKNMKLKDKELKKLIKEDATDLIIKEILAFRK